ncbi:MAG: hypothetical protein KDJ90_00435 [Nitratireductor sp.]|nr:hypothetical protein [Nitratireductor sp.]
MQNVQQTPPQTAVNFRFHLLALFHEGVNEDDEELVVRSVVLSFNAPNPVPAVTSGDPEKSAQIFRRILADNGLMIAGDHNATELDRLCSPEMNRKFAVFNSPGLAQGAMVGLANLNAVLENPVAVVPLELRRRLAS